MSDDTRASFIGLPRELRNIIYECLLVDPYTIDARPLGARYWMYSDPPKIEICTALLLVNKQLSCEAAEILYSRNRFRFDYPLGWSCISSWIQRLEPQNIAFLRNVHISGVFMGSQSLQLEDGTRTVIPGEISNCFPLNASFHPLTLPTKTGLVDDIDPVAEMVVAGLCSPPRSKQLSLKISYFGADIPGVIDESHLSAHRRKRRFDEVSPGVSESHFPNGELKNTFVLESRVSLTMDLPNLTQKWVGQYCQLSGRDVDVLWEFELKKDVFEYLKPKILEVWEIVDVEERDAEREPLPVPDVTLSLCCPPPPDKLLPSDPLEYLERSRLRRLSEEDNASEDEYSFEDEDLFEDEDPFEDDEFDL